MDRALNFSVFFCDNDYLAVEYLLKDILSNIKDCKILAISDGHTPSLKVKDSRLKVIYTDKKLKYFYLPKYIVRNFSYIQKYLANYFIHLDPDSRVVKFNELHIGQDWAGTIIPSQQWQTVYGCGFTMSQNVVNAILTSELTNEDVLFYEKGPSLDLTLGRLLNQKEIFPSSWLNLSNRKLMVRPTMFCANKSHNSRYAVVHPWQWVD